MEALRTQVDSLHWEAHRLHDAENRKSRDRNPEGSCSRVDCEAEFEKARSDSTELRDRV